MFTLNDDRIIKVTFDRKKERLGAGIIEQGTRRIISSVEDLYAYLEVFEEYQGDEGGEIGDVDLSDRDILFEDAARLIVLHQQGSTSLIQRKMKLGYNRSLAR